MLSNKPGERALRWKRRVICSFNMAQVGFQFIGPAFLLVHLERGGCGRSFHCSGERLQRAETFSTFERLGYVDLMGGLMGGAGICNNQELE